MIYTVNELTSQPNKKMNQKNLFLLLFPLPDILNYLHLYIHFLPFLLFKQVTCMSCSSMRPTPHLHSKSHALLSL